MSRALFFQGRVRADRLRLLHRLSTLFDNRSTHGQSHYGSRRIRTSCGTHPIGTYRNQAIFGVETSPVILIARV